MAHKAFARCCRGCCWGAATFWTQPALRRAPPVGVCRCRGLVGVATAHCKHRHCTFRTIPPQPRWWCACRWWCVRSCCNTCGTQPPHLCCCAHVTGADHARLGGPRDRCTTPAGAATRCASMWPFAACWLGRGMPRHGSSSSSNSPRRQKNQPRRGDLGLTIFSSHGGSNMSRRFPSASPDACASIDCLALRPISVASTTPAAARHRQQLAQHRSKQ